MPLTHSPPGSSFLVYGQYDRYSADVEAGVHALTTSGVNMKLDYEGRLSGDSEQHAGSLKVSAPY